MSTINEILRDAPDGPDGGFPQGFNGWTTTEGLTGPRRRSFLCVSAFSFFFVFPLWEMASLVSSLLSTYLNVLVKGFNKNQLSLGIWSGTLTLKNARLLFPFQSFISRCCDVFRRWVAWLFLLFFALLI